MIPELPDWEWERQLFPSSLTLEERNYQFRAETLENEKRIERLIERGVQQDRGQRDSGWSPEPEHTGTIVREITDVLNIGRYELVQEDDGEIHQSVTPMTLEAQIVTHKHRAEGFYEAPASTDASIVETAGLVHEDSHLTAKIVAATSRVSMIRVFKDGSPEIRKAQEIIHTGVGTVIVPTDDSGSIKEAVAFKTPVVEETESFSLVQVSVASLVQTKAGKEKHKYEFGEKDVQQEATKVLQYNVKTLTPQNQEFETRSSTPETTRNEPKSFKEARITQKTSTQEQPKNYKHFEVIEKNLVENGARVEDPQFQDATYRVEEQGNRVLSDSTVTTTPKLHMPFLQQQTEIEKFTIEEYHKTFQTSAGLNTTIDEAYAACTHPSDDTTRIVAVGTIERSKDSGIFVDKYTNITKVQLHSPDPDPSIESPVLEMPHENIIVLSPSGEAACSALVDSFVGHCVRRDFVMEALKKRKEDYKKAKAIHGKDDTNVRKIKIEINELKHVIKIKRYEATRDAVINAVEGTVSSLARGTTAYMGCDDFRQNLVATGAEKVFELVRPSSVLKDETKTEGTSWAAICGEFGKYLLKAYLTSSRGMKASPTAINLGIEIGAHILKEEAKIVLNPGPTNNQTTQLTVYEKQNLYIGTCFQMASRCLGGQFLRWGATKYLLPVMDLAPGVLGSILKCAMLAATTSLGSGLVDRIWEFIPWFKPNINTKQTALLTEYGLTESSDLHTIQVTYKQLLITLHPDKGGNHEKFIKFKRDFEEIMEYRKKTRGEELGWARVKKILHAYGLFAKIIGWWNSEDIQPKDRKARTTKAALTIAGFSEPDASWIEDAVSKADPHQSLFDLELQIPH